MSGQIEYRCSRCAITFEVDYANGGESPLLGVECLCLDCRKPKTKKVMSTTPQRYDPSDKNVAVMIGITDGDYVLFSDYEALRAERDSLKAQINDMRGGLDECDGCGMLCGDGVLIDGRCQGCRSRL